jgi:hypothetical protein
MIEITRKRIGLENFCKDEKIRATHTEYLEAAVRMLELVYKYECGALGINMWERLKDLLAVRDESGEVEEIIHNAYNEYIEYVKRGEAPIEQRQHINKQVVIYNDMLHRAFEELDEEHRIHDPKLLTEDNIKIVDTEAIVRKQHGREL